MKRRLYKAHKKNKLSIAEINLFGIRLIAMDCPDLKLKEPSSR
jgi:hypothetical protein